MTTLLPDLFDDLPADERETLEAIGEIARKSVQRQKRLLDALEIPPTPSNLRHFALGGWPIL
ncbi:MAG: hypothetical protein GY835_24715 [bacterium]|nr:hypothetical protein [bacterium]